MRFVSMASTLMLLAGEGVSRVHARVKREGAHLGLFIIGELVLHHLNGGNPPGPLNELSKLLVGGMLIGLGIRRLSKLASSAPSTSSV